MAVPKRFKSYRHVAQDGHLGLPLPHEESPPSSILFSLCYLVLEFQAVDTGVSFS